MGEDSRQVLITKTFDYDGGRQVTVSVPDRDPVAIVYAGDGQLIASWGASLANSDVPPIMIVGVHSTSDPDEMVRIREYSPHFDPEQFAAHEKFFVDDVRHWVKMAFGVEFSPQRTAVCGVSASGELSLALGLRHPEMFGHVFSMSPGGGYQPPDILPNVLPRVYLTAGRQEPWFLENAKRWYTALNAVGAETVMTEREGDHGDPFWAEEFPLMVNWMLSGASPVP